MQQGVCITNPLNNNNELVWVRVRLGYMGGGVILFFALDNEMSLLYVC